MLPSTLLTVSASAILWLSRLNRSPYTIAVYASQPPSPATTQHSLPGARYGLPAPVFHRLDRASFPGAQAFHMKNAVGFVPIEDSKVIAAASVAKSITARPVTARSSAASATPDDATACKRAELH